MAAQLAGLVILGTVLAFNAGHEPAFRTLGSSTAPALSGETLAVVFDPAITEAELRRVIVDIGARIVDGPTTAGAFVLEVPATNSDAAILRLRAHPGVQFAESLGARVAR